MTDSSRPSYFKLVLPFALGLMLSYIFRTTNAYMAPVLVDELGLNAGSLGLLTASYFLGFSLTQIPLGIALDRWGARKVQLLLLSLAGLGSLVFAYADALSQLAAARVVIGVGVAGCLMASVKHYRDFFSPDQMPLLVAWTLSGGALGGILTTTPLAWLMQFLSWRQVFMLLAALSLAMALWMAVVPSRHQPQPATTSLRHSFALILKQPQFWHVALIFVLSNGLFLALQGLWLGPWLHQVVGWSRSDSATGLLFSAIGFVVGNPLWGWLLQRLAQAKRALLAPVGLALAGFVLLTGLMFYGVVKVNLLWCFGFGLIGAATNFGVALIGMSFDAHTTGKASTLLNLSVFLSSFALQWGIGQMTEHWGGQLQLALQIAWLLLLPGLGVSLWLGIKR